MRNMMVVMRVEDVIMRFRWTSASCYIFSSEVLDRG